MAVVQYRGRKGGSYRRYQSRITYGSRRAVSDELYLMMAFSGTYMRYVDYDSLTPGQQGAIDTAAIGLTAFYNLMGLVAAGGTMAGALATGNWAFAALVGLSIPLQLEIMVENVNAWVQNEKLRLYFNRRHNYIMGVS